MINVQNMLIDDQIWTTLCNVKYNSYCLGFVVSRFQKWERNMNIFLAVTSSGSIAAWAIWTKMPMLWGTIIAASQVVNVIKPFLPYFKYVKELNAKNFQMEMLSIEFEKLWNEVYNKTISPKDKSDCYFKLKDQMVGLLRFGDDTIFEVDDTIKGKAEKQMDIYLKNNYSIVREN